MYPSFPTRRSYDLYVDDKTQTENDPLEVTAMRMLKRQLPNIIAEATSKQYSSYKRADKKIGDDLFDAYMAARHALETRGRSEEHTSELQSLMRISYAVFCLKKKNNTYDEI